MEKLLRELDELDSRENHLETFDNLLMVYLSSKDADSHEERVSILLLASKLRRLFM
ncbi:hypothetical protein VS868_12030 [Salinimicrobium sp. 3283s]|uniref:hypothetical protein n=1 Tax=Salinimicrobium sp. 3283s TaxID=3114359 RepID=UPI0031F19D66